MRISISTTLLVASIGFGAGAASAASGSYICAVGEVFECEAVIGCKRVSAGAINLSKFIVIDIDKKQLSETAIGEDGQTEDIEGLTVTDKAIFLHGTQDQETWNMSVSLENGAMTGGITSAPSSFAVFGHCTQK